MNLTHKINRLCEIFDKGHYFFSKTKDNDIMLRFENDDETYFEFRGSSMCGAVKVAEEYAQNQIKQKIDEKADTVKNDNQKKQKKSVSEKQAKLFN